MLQLLIDNLKLDEVVKELDDSELWGKVNFRTASPASPHREAEDIILRYPVMESADDAFNTIPCIPYDAWYELPRCQVLVFDLMRYVNGVQLGKVIASKIPPQGQVYSHFDEGIANEVYTRFQFSLQGDTCFVSEGKEYFIKEGSVFRFDNELQHSLTNIGDIDRYALIVDILI